MTELVARAAMNNAQWCDAVCRAHGVPASFAAHAWVARAQAPPFYPQLVTLSANGVEEQLHLLGDLRRSLSAPGWGMKDSFDVLDLAPQGFEPMFRARWAVIVPGPRARSAWPADLRVSRARSLEALTRWESAWSLGEREKEGNVRIFRPGLLEEPEIAFLSVSHGEELVAGLVANRGAGLVGVSNLFVTDPRRPESLCPALAEAEAMWPGLPLVGYAADDGGALEWQLGFRRLASLTVWRSTGA